MSTDSLADEVWQTMAAVVVENRDSWKRAVVEQSGLPFSRARILRRLEAKAMTAKQLAEATAMDAPAATVAINDLEERGLVVRQPDPDNRRCKLVSLTESGADLMRSIRQIDDPAPPVFETLDAAELTTLLDLLGRLRRH
ncbi:MarR family transcriptional regulator [Mycobacterium sp. CBMA293]|uniref:MarR family winged helix-turn-helix transcriptional regulator n=1 Tax=unclassified Mycolicibacterium TaxID=2636767 RepID=UPI00132745FF|nr:MULTISPECIES: MarR family transcriptional regulator [unclassified Mycolicibacterium]MUL48866.1 MarR family transcriptional regulator [Mycolicibacterium sp. CBMA 360]MUL96862.1 MarR family transcriptional regulator [Mycolicibacterium sp. CBMA 230]MUM31558.1 MarR family transcriptional regulator [Mycolicibacterium sp. CBMA 361]MUL62477.1 MarR family transcriptional regulator [Mycolicibacterium sp. CBMA 335]MUL74168.1 MarR family transcriptional regulator [Mycolicibacterium sp. CBMA 311]